MCRSGATEVNLMGPMLAMLLRQPPRPDDRDHRLRLVYTAASTPEVALPFIERFGVEIVEGYGMTDPLWLHQSPIRAEMGIGRRAAPAAVRTVRQRGPDPGRERDADDGPGMGEIAIRNQATFSEYWGDPAATEAAMRDGWLRTGDLGYRDEDGYYIVGRAKESSVRRNGVNTSPAEVEAAVHDDPNVDEAALVGLPNPLGEELAILAVTVTAGAPVAGLEQRVLAKLRKVLSREKDFRSRRGGGSNAQDLHPPHRARETADMPETKRDRGSGGRTPVASLSKGLLVLEALASMPAKGSLAELMSRTGFDRATINQILRSFIDAGYVERRSRGDYGISNQGYVLGVRLTNAHHLIRVAEPELRALLERTRRP